MQILHSIKVPCGQDPDLKQLAAKQLGIAPEKISTLRIVKKSLDARTRSHFYWVYSLEVFLDGENPAPAFEEFPKLGWRGPPPLIIGAGPAGLFAAWTFLQHGIQPILFERGERAHPRMKKISRYWRRGELDPESNVCNGEGGAGTFSDGKLVTRIKSPHIPRVMQAFVDYGAPAEIAYVYNPHVGSNLIREVIRRMGDDLIARGADMRFQTHVEKLHVTSDGVRGVVLKDGSRVDGSGLVLACGHSAGDFFRVLAEQGVRIEAKSFALGLRIEHPQSRINAWQYGEQCNIPGLEAAQYKLATKWDNDSTGVYSFCMCPGGYVISSSTDADGIVVNGMSNLKRNSPWANAAIVASVDCERIPSDGAFRMLEFQREIEHRVYSTSAARGESRRVPAQRLEDFLAKRVGHITTRPSCPSGIVDADLTQLLPKWIIDYLCRGLKGFEKNRRGFLDPDAILYAVESRTSSPIRMTRDVTTLESISTRGLFPCGEGPGYAGGITSAAVDGIRAALAWIAAFVE